MKYILFLFTISIFATHYNPKSSFNYKNYIKSNFKNFMESNKETTFGITNVRPDEGVDNIGNGFGDDEAFFYETEHFKFWYTKTGKHSVPLVDADENDVPDYIDLAAKVGEEVWEFYFTTLGYDTPISDGTAGGNSKMDFYFINLSGADGYIVTESCSPSYQCSGFMVIENDFKFYNYPSQEYALKVLISHEFFHIVQNSYFANGKGWVFWTEGTAVLNEELYFPEQDDFENFLPAFFDETEVALNYKKPSGSPDGRTYGSAIWAYWLTLQYGDEVIREMWEKAREDSKTNDEFTIFTIFDDVLKTHGSSFKETFLEFSIANIFTKDRAINNFGYPKADNYPMLKFENDTDIKDIGYNYEYLSSMSANRYFKLNFYSDMDIVISISSQKDEINKEDRTISIIDPLTGEIIARGEGELEFSIKGTTDYYLDITDTRVEGRRLSLILDITEKPSCKNTKCHKFSTCTMLNEIPTCMCDDGFVDYNGGCTPEVEHTTVDKGCDFSSNNSNSFLFFIIFFLLFIFKVKINRFQK